ncbi:MAG: hypothetical protein JSR76_05720 [Verrucomicrobia bacterium]|nr:hypothetical protein [Verrucomicrobiota bacterium]
MSLTVENCSLILHPGPYKDFAFQIAAKELSRHTVVIKCPGETARTLARHQELCLRVLQGPLAFNSFAQPLIPEEFGNRGFYRDGLSLALSTGMPTPVLERILLGWIATNAPAITTCLYVMPDTDLRDRALQVLSDAFAKGKHLPRSSSRAEQLRCNVLSLEKSLKTAARIRTEATRLDALESIFTYFANDYDTIKCLLETLGAGEFFRLLVVLLPALTRDIRFNHRAPTLATYLPEGEMRDRYLRLICKQAFDTWNFDLGIDAAALFSDSHERRITKFFFNQIPRPLPVDFDGYDEEDSSIFVSEL